MRLLWPALILIPACSFEDPYDTPVNLPSSNQIQQIDTDGWIIIHLTKEGALRLGSEAVTLDELRLRLTPRRAERPRPSVLLCIDRDAIYLHVALDTLYQWLLESRPESVEVRAEPEVRHKFVVAVIDRLRAAGVESITVR